MKNKAKSKYLLSIFIDFIFIVLLISLAIGAFFTAKLLLYPEGSSGGELRIRTEPMPEEYKGWLCVGDTVFDTLTKRRVGEIAELETAEAGDKIYFLITVDSEFIPRSKALRTSRLWFYYAREDL